MVTAYWAVDCGAGLHCWRSRETKKMSSRSLLLLSNSTVHGSGYLEWAAHHIKEFLTGKNVKRVLFVPYALRKMDNYAETAQKKFTSWGFELDSIHKAEDPVSADGIPYIGSSAGTNMATVSINTTNDMPIVFPPSFTALALIPFNINPHYIDADPASKHMGETREERINQYHEIPDTPAVLGLREGALLHVTGQSAVLKGLHPARLFRCGKLPEEFPLNTDFSFLLQ
ncbi:Alpha-aspartyl dipeptidase-like [Homarus americanus]|uniref:Alpha-aspartyl dipeptidase-like n=1 Tax=Homarus americanus TaxID=6706 RepID=A0A8J5JS41_HOMAM|nr:Alpha-aspartyl dipeptidase-like [Homarus americanus]